MGVVYLATDRVLGRAVAVKVLTDDKDELRERFAREARSVAALKHNSIVTIYDIGEDQGRPFIAMEFLAGETMAELIRRRASLSVARKLQLMTELCEGLGYAHRNKIIHRDIKPANLMVTTEGTLKILDFGLARVAAEITSTGLTRVGTLMGTPYYMSPEQVEGKTADARSDIFAVGLVLYELLSYQKAFPGDSSHIVLHDIVHKSPRPIIELVPQIDAELARVVERGLEKKPEDRYPDLGALAAELGRIRDRLMTSRSDATVLVPIAGREPHPRQPTGEGGTPAAGDRTPGSGGRHIPNLLAIQQKRAEQIDAALRLALECFESGDYEHAIEHCENVMLLDPQQPRALELLDQVHRAIDDRQVAEWLEDARAEMSRRAFSAAGALIQQSLKLQPNSTEALALEEELRAHRREKERAAEIARALDMAIGRARASLADGALDAALRSASEALAYDANCAEAVALKRKIEVAIQARQRDEEAEQRIADALTRARRHVAAGSYEAALTILRSLGSTSPAVQSALADIEVQRQAAVQKRLKDQGQLEVAEDALRSRAWEAGGPSATEQTGHDSTINTELPGFDRDYQFQQPEEDAEEEEREETGTDFRSRWSLGKLVAAGLLVVSLALVVYVLVRGLRQDGTGGSTAGQATHGGGTDQVAPPPPPPPVDYAPILAAARRNTDVDALAAVALIRKIPADAREHAAAQDLLRDIRTNAADAAAAARQKAMAANAMSQGAFLEGDRQLRKADGLTDPGTAIPAYLEAARSFSRAATAELTPPQLFQLAQDAFREGKTDEAIDYAQRAHQRNSRYQPALGFLNARRADEGRRTEDARKKAIAAGASVENSQTFKLALAKEQSATAHPPLETREAIAKFREAFDGFELAAAQVGQQRTQLANEVKEAVGRANELLKSRDVAGAQVEIDKIRAKDRTNPALQPLEQRLKGLEAELAREEERSREIEKTAADKARAVVLLGESRALKDHADAIDRLQQARKLDPDSEDIRTALAERQKALNDSKNLPVIVTDGEEAAILRVLDDFAAAYSKKRMDLIQSVYPRAPSRLSAPFNQFTTTIWAWGERKVKIQVHPTGAGEPTAIVECEVNITFKGGRTEDAQDRVPRRFGLQKSSGRWVIVSLELASLPR